MFGREPRPTVGFKRCIAQNKCSGDERPVHCTSVLFYCCTTVLLCYCCTIVLLYYGTTYCTTAGLHCTTTVLYCSCTAHNMRTRLRSGKLVRRLVAFSAYKPLQISNVRALQRRRVLRCRPESHRSHSARARPGHVGPNT